MKSADRTMNERVSEYATVRLSDITDKTRHKAAVEAIENSIRGLENCKGSVLSSDDIDLAIAAKRDELVKLEEDYKEALKKRERFVYTKEDIELYNAYKNNENLETALYNWAMAWNLDLSGTKQLSQMAVDVSGKQGKASARTMINTGFGTMTRDRSKQNFLDLVYGLMTEACVKQGLKMDIPDDIRVAYAPKRAQKKADK
jgi:hypothetical protein